MYVLRKFVQTYVNAMLVASGALVCTVMPLLPARADSYPLVPQTKLRVTIVQWVPAKGEYQRWDGVSGDFIVSDAGTITLPLVGTISVANVDSAALAPRIGEQLKTAIGLNNVPDTTVAVLEYPPVYVLGDVETPGAYAFRPGLTVLQALALSGGQFRDAGQGSASGEIKQVVNVLGELRGLRADILRALGRIARLRAENADEKEIQFPAELTSDPDKNATTEIMAQEKVIFTARASALTRQLDSFSELRSLFTKEVEILEQKTGALEDGIKLAEEELAGVRSLFERGIATASRRSELERGVVTLRSNRLDEVTATMRARQNLSEAIRNALNLRDKRYTDTSTELQEAQASLERLRIREVVLKQVLALTEPSVLSDRRDDLGPDSAAASFTIIRRAQGKSEEVASSESTSLLPGDVVKVAVPRRSGQRTATYSLFPPSQ